MTSLSVLIEKHCPNGVRHLHFPEVASITRGITYSKRDEEADGAIKVFRANNITLKNCVLNLDDVKRLNSRVKVRDDQLLKADDILICAGSGSKEHIGKVAYIWENRKETFGGFMGVIRSGEQLNPRFLFHLLRGNTFKAYLASAISSTTINNLNAAVMAGWTVPVPPLEVQRSIVAILDKFTSLEAELEAELEARKRQYEFYRNELLSLKSSGLQEQAYSIYELGNVASISTGTRPSNQQLEAGGEIKYFNGGTKASGSLSEANTPAKSITIPSRGSVGIVAWQPSAFWCGPLCYRIRSLDESLILKEFLYYFLKENEREIVALQSTGSIPALNKKELEQVSVPVPSISKQMEIVHALDSFVRLNIALAAELEARRKQYEHYREQLLTFEELVEA